MAVTGLTSAQLGWPRCSSPGCTGAGVYGPNADTCLAHLGDEELGSVLNDENEPLDARGVKIGAGLASRIRDALRRGGRFEAATFEDDLALDGAVFGGDLLFDRATFERAMTFAGATFEAGASFVDATFCGSAGFGQARFRRGADFRGATFNRVAWFGGATFERGGEPGAATIFERTRFRGLAEFARATVRCAVRFRETSFEGAANFEKARFEDEATFDRSTFGGVLTFRRTAFERSVGFPNASFEDYALFEASSFDGVADFEQADFGGIAEFAGAAFTGPARFAEATFEGHAGFEEARFRDGADFHAATFKRAAWFEGTTFGDVVFTNVKFRGPAGFARAGFMGGARFGEASFADEAAFLRASFAGHAGFESATFRIGAGFGAATFEGDAGFADATFVRTADFSQATFRQAADFEAATFGADVVFREATLEKARRLGPLRARGTLTVDSAECLAPLTIRAEAAAVTGRSARFSGGARLALSGGEIVLEDAEFERRSLVGAVGEPARLLSLRRARIAELTLGGLDLRSCLFAGVHGLDRLTIEDDCLFERLAGRWNGRVAIAEEHLREVEPSELASIYRELRCARVGGRVASDFRYGELEMRRIDPHGSRSERGLLTLHRLTSGYAQRAGRAFASLGAAVVLFALLLWGVGFDARPSFLRALIVSAEGTLGLFRAPALAGHPLSYGGELLEICLRLLGPLLLGLALISLLRRASR